MNSNSTLHSHDARRPFAGRFFLGLVPALVPLALLGACDRSTPAAPSSNAPGTMLTNPDSGESFVVDANRGGEASEVRLAGAYWGRLVDVLDVSGAVQLRGFVIGEDIISDGVNYLLERNEITDSETLTILHPAGSPEFAARVADIERHLQPIAKHGSVPSPTAVLSAIPRNATLVLAFDDLIDASTITAENVRVLVGYPPITPYDARVVADASHGDLRDADGDGQPEFHTTRVLVDLAVSPIEALLSSPPLPANAVGLPEAVNVDQPNVLMRIPTRALPASGQVAVLANLSGATLRPAANAPSDPQSATEDVVRAMRSSSAGLLDPNNGFLADNVPPRIVGVQPIQIWQVTSTGGNNYKFDALFDAGACAPSPRVGDVIRVGTAAIAVVTQDWPSTPLGGFVHDVRVRLEVGNAQTFVPGAAQYLMRFDPSAGLPPSCYVRVAPTPTAAPDQGVQPASTFTVRFTKPMDPRSVTAFEGFSITRVSNAQPQLALSNTIIGRVQPSADLRELTLVPLLPLERQPLNFPAGEQYRLTLDGGPNGVRDLSGNALRDSLPAFLFRLDPAAAQIGSRGFSFKFNSVDEDGNGAPELRGQFLFDLAKGRIRPRAVTRFSSVVDANQPVVGLMTPFTSPIQTPLSNLGSKLMTVWRYHDLGFSLLDESTLNVDLEGLNWAPLGGVSVDHYTNFRMAFAHSKFLPDEALSAINLLPLFPQSGLVKTFDANLLDATEDPLRVLHPKTRGYDVQPSDSFVASTGTVMMPFPLNRGIPNELKSRYTLRDTAILAVGGPNGAGVDTAINAFATGVPQVVYYPSSKVPTIGLPLLMEFRCYPDDQAFGLNGFKVNLALNSSARPAFRAYSTGGINATGGIVKIDPDNQPNATGGFGPGGVPTGPGLETDSLFYLGQADFVVRVSRVHTIWMDTVAFTAQFQPPVVEPPNALQPTGTRVVVAMRGATNVTNGSVPPGGVVPRQNAASYDPYGDPKPAVLVPSNFAATFPLGPGGVPDKSWKSLPGPLANLRFVQARITLISNPDTQLVPELDALGIAFRY